MARKKGTFQKSKPKNKLVEQFKLNAAKKKLHDLGMELIKEDDIKKYYSEYQAFMQWDHPLDFTIEAFSGKNENRNDWATVRPPAKIGAPYTLEVNITASTVRKNDYKSLLFHEFTHIFDNLTIHERIRAAGVDSVGSWYTEAHATEVELMCSCGYESATSASKVDLLKSIPYYGGEITVKEFGLRRKVDIEKCLEAGNIGSATKHLQYYFGFLLFVKKHCVFTEDEFSSLLETEFLNQYFGDYAIKIRDILLKPHISATNFRQMKNLQTTMIRMMAAQKVFKNMQQNNKA